MKIVNLVQGSPEWHAHRANHFNASDAPAMMGVSKYTTRNELIHRLATGETKEVTPAEQALYDRGHAAEAAVRPKIEAMLCEDLYPIIGVCDTDPALAKLSASYDGMDMDMEVAMEAKLWNADLVAQVRAGEITDPHYWVQLEQHYIVNERLRRLIFVVTKDDASEYETLDYVPVPGRREQIIAGWVQIKKDVDAYVPKVTKAEVVAAPVANLPAIVYEIERGTMALSSNLPAFRAATEALVERTKAPLVTDQDFADREALCKKMRDAEAMLKAKADEVVGQIADVATFSRELKDLAEMFRTTALASEKLVAAEKTNRRNAIQQGGEQALTKHIATLQARFAGRVQMPAYRADFAGAIKGKRTLESIQNAVDTVLAQGKIETNAMADAIDANLRTLDTLAPEHGFLFRDLQNLVTMPAEAFRATVEGRVATHKAQEAAKLAAETERIERETRERLEREAREEERRLAQQEPATLLAPTLEQTAANVEAATNGALTVVAAPAPQVTTAAPAALVVQKTDTMATYAALRRQDIVMPSIPVLVGTISEAFGVSDTQAVRWLLTLNANDLNEYLKTTTEAQEA